MNTYKFLNQLNARPVRWKMQVQPTSLAMPLAHLHMDATFPERFINAHYNDESMSFGRIAASSDIKVLTQIFFHPPRKKQRNIATQWKQAIQRATGL